MMRLLTVLWVLLGLPAVASGTTYISLDFEDGQTHQGFGGPYPNLVPTVVMTEPSGNHFLRLTASPSDCGSLFFTTCPRTRAETNPGLTSGLINQTLTYSFRMRYPGTNPASGQNAMMWQLFQAGVPTGGQTVWFGVRNGRFIVCNGEGNVYDDTTCPALDLGPVVFDEWHDWRLAIFLSTATDGRVDAYRDGTLLGNLTGQPTAIDYNGVFNMYVYLDAMDLNGIFNAVDMDNVKIESLPSDQSATLTWIANPAGENVTNYTIYRLLGACGVPGAVTLLTTVGVVTTFTDTNLPLGTVGASYELTASNAAGESGHSVRVCKSFTSSPSPPDSVRVQ